MELHCGSRVPSNGVYLVVEILLPSLVVFYIVCCFSRSSLQEDIVGHGREQSDKLNISLNPVQASYPSSVFSAAYPFHTPSSFKSQLLPQIKSPYEHLPNQLYKKYLSIC